MEAVGPVLILVAIPMILRWVPPNRLYGFRVWATLHNESVWYDANVLAGRHLLALGLLLVALDFVLPASARVGVLRVVAIVGFVAITIWDWRTANRWERERSSHGDTR